MKADPEDVIAFVEVAGRGSFSAAARALGVPKSSISRRVQKLEKTLSTQLVQRTTRRLHLTEAGQSYYARSRRALEELEGAEQTLEGMLEKPRGVLKISVPIDLSDAVGRLVEIYLNKFSEVAVVTNVSNARVDLVAEGYDLALRAGVLQDSTLVARKLAESQLLLVASPAYLERHGAPTRLEELRGHQCVLFGSSVQTTWELMGPRGLEQVKVTGTIVANDFRLLQRAVLHGRGIARFPWHIPRLELASGTMVRVLPDYRGISPALYVVYPSAAYLSPKVRHFVDLCLKFPLFLPPESREAPRGELSR
jgi:DNA-binding transcriptional LysR family regulator